MDFDRRIEYSLVPQSTTVALPLTDVFIMNTRRHVYQVNTDKSGRSESILDQGDRLIDVPDVARLFRVSVHALYMQRLRGQPPGSLGIKVGARVLFRPDVIKSWLEEIQEEQAQEPW